MMTYDYFPRFTDESVTQRRGVTPKLVWGAGQECCVRGTTWYFLRSLPPPPRVATWLPMGSVHGFLFPGMGGEMGIPEGE